MGSAPICVYGATGYTGRLIAEELARREAPMVLAGRRADAVAKVAAAVRQLGGEVVAERTAPVDDPEGLRNVLRGCSAVVNAAGPFLWTGAPVLQAAIDVGVHYVDTTGEQPWIREVFERFDPLLEAAGVAAVPAMGFDYVPGDLLCHLVGTSVEPLAELRLAYDAVGFDPTRGTMRSALEMLKGGDVTYRGGAWRPAGLGPLRATVHFPDGIGRRRAAKYPCGEVITVPRHVKVRDVTHLISTSSLVPPGPLAEVFPLLSPLVQLALRTPLRALLHEAIGHLPEGPAEDARKAVSWLIVAHAIGEDGREATGVVRGPDIYGLTAVTAVEGALLLGRGGAIRSTGALAPAMAFDATAFLRHLAPAGVRWDVPQGVPVGA